MQKGDFIKIDFIGRVSATQEIFDLTVEEVARKERAYNERQKYGPVLVIIGANMVVPGVEKQLENMEPGQEGNFQLKPDEAFGRREPGLIKIMPRSSFISQKIEPVPGIFVNINGQQAKIQNVTGGRIRVDFNHPLAGKDLDYWVKIAEQITEPLAKARALMEYYGIQAEVSLEGPRLSVKTKKAMPDLVRGLVEEKFKEWVAEIKEIEFSTEEKAEDRPGESKNQDEQQAQDAAPDASA